MPIFFKDIPKITAASWLLIIGVFLTSMARYIVTPFFAIYLVEKMHFSITAAGVAVAAKVWGQRGLALIGGPMVDWLGAKRVIGLGILLMAASYVFTAFSSGIVAIVIWTLVLGLGGSFYAPAVKTAIVHSTSAYKEKVFLLSLRSTSVNLGSALGPLMGALIFVISPKMIFIATAIILVILAIASQYVLKIPAVKEGDGKMRLSDIIAIFTHLPTLKLILFVGLFYVFFIQLEVTYPIFTATTFQSQTVSYLFLLNALMIVIFQMPLSDWIARTSVNTVFLIGMCALSLGFILTGFAAYSKLIFFTGVAIFSLGELLIMPKLDSDVSSDVPQHLVGTTFGILGVASAIGAAIGGILGGRMFHIFQEYSRAGGYWITLGLLAMLVMLSVLITKWHRPNPRVH